MSGEHSFPFLIMEGSLETSPNQFHLAADKQIIWLFIYQQSGGGNTRPARLILCFYVSLGVDHLIFDRGLCKSPKKYRAYASG